MLCLFYHNKIIWKKRFGFPKLGVLPLYEKNATVCISWPLSCYLVGGGPGGVGGHAATLATAVAVSSKVLCL